jgi:hypothetical protein
MWTPKFVLETVLSWEMGFQGGVYLVSGLLHSLASAFLPCRKTKFLASYSFLSSHMWSHSMKALIRCQHFYPGLPSLQNRKKQIPFLYKLPNLWCFVTAVQQRHPSERGWVSSNQLTGVKGKKWHFSGTRKLRHAEASALPDFPADAQSSVQISHLTIGWGRSLQCACVCVCVCGLY